MFRKALLITNFVLLLACILYVNGTDVDKKAEADESNLQAEHQKRDSEPTKTEIPIAPSKGKRSVGEGTSTTSSKFSAKRLPKGSGLYKNNGYYGDNDEYYGKDKYEKGYPSKTGEYKVGESSSSSEEKVSMLASLDVWISAADDWEHDRPDYRGKGSSKTRKSSKGGSYKNNDGGSDYQSDKASSRSKRSYSRVRFPVRQFQKISDFPLRRFPPLISIMPWLPIFYDKLTYQTFIFSPTGGIYVLPPLINFYGQRFAVAQLIKWGYASLVSTGVPPPPNINVAPLVAPAPVGGAITAGVVGSETARVAPAFDSRHSRFSDGVRTEFPPFRPRYPRTMYEQDGQYYASTYNQGQAYGSNYGGAGLQDGYGQSG